MGTYTQHAILVSSSMPVTRRGYDSWELRPPSDVEGMDWADYAHKKAVEIFGEQCVSPVTEGGVNPSQRSFFVAPDGAKEGSPESSDFDTRRTRFIEWLRQWAFSDRSTPIDWVEVQFGENDVNTRTLRSSDDDYKAGHPEWFGAA